jgi:hypothetical protein
MQWVEKVVEPVVRRKNEDDLIVGPSAPNSGPQIALDKKANKYAVRKDTRMEAIPHVIYLWPLLLYSFFKSA